MGCASEAPRIEPVEPPVAPPGTSGPVALPPTATTLGPEPSAPAPLDTAVTRPPKAPPVASGKDSCLMWYVCGCNVGCSKVAVPRDKLKDGLSVQVVSGTEKGKRGFVFETKDKSGATVFGIGRDKPGGMGICAATPDPRYFGYGCESSKSGPIDAQSCDDACQ